MLTEQLLGILNLPAIDQFLSDKWGYATKGWTIATAITITAITITTTTTTTTTTAAITTLLSHTLLHTTIDKPSITYLHPSLLHSPQVLLFLYPIQSPQPPSNCTDTSKFLLLLCT